MMPNRQARALFPANRDLVLHDQLADVLESHRSLVQLHAVRLRQSVDQIGGGDRLGHSVLPAAALDQVIKEQGNHVIRLQEGSVGVDYAEAIGVAIGRDANLGLRLAHLFTQIFEQMIVGFGSMSAEQAVTLPEYAGALPAGAA